MKKILCVVAIATFFASCNKETSDGYVVSGTVLNIADGEKVFIEIQTEDQMGVSAIDTAVVKDGKFKFEGKIEEIQMGFLGLGTNRGKIPFILENEKINITAYVDSIQKSKVGGSYNNEELTKFNTTFEGLQKKMSKFQQEKMGVMQEARQNNDTVVINKISEEYKVLEEEFRGYMENYASENPKSFISLMLLSQMINSPSADFEKIKTNVEALSPELKATKIGKKLDEAIKSISLTSVGQKAPDFSAPNPEGQMISLKESLGKVTIIDFWASWCGPCRIENPHVVALYNEFHEKGLNIIGVSLDREDQKDKWIEAIATDKLTWPQVSNLKFWQDPIARQYNITSIPATFILDETGTIVAKNLKGEELKNKVIELLEK